MWVSFCRIKPNLVALSILSTIWSKGYCDYLPNLLIRISKTPSRSSFLIIYFLITALSIQSCKKHLNYWLYFIPSSLNFKIGDLPIKFSQLTIVLGHFISPIHSSKINFSTYFSLYWLRCPRFRLACALFSLVMIFVSDIFMKPDSSLYKSKNIFPWGSPSSAPQRLKPHGLDIYWSVEAKAKSMEFVSNGSFHKVQFIASREATLK